MTGRDVPPSFTLPARAPGLWRRLNDARLAVMGPLRFGDAVCRGPATKKAVALTFDDGPDAEITPRILEVLASKRARATFFFTGVALENHPEVAIAAAERNQIGTHLYAHDRKKTATLAAFEAEARRSIWLHESILKKKPSALRYPFGDAGQVRREDAERFGLTPYHWTFSSEDSSATSPEEIVRHVLPRLHAGSIVLLHDGIGPNSQRSSGPRAHTLAALPALIDAALRRGFELVTLDELFAP
jgi:peptidoglycan/xylan/chitin deacetylase (PgdA/CDA1 family)